MTGEDVLNNKTVYNVEIQGGSLSFVFKQILDLNTDKAMAPHSSTLAWKIPWMEEPGRL